MTHHIKSSTCPDGSTPTQNDFYCKVGDVITYPEEYAGEHTATCGSEQSSARSIPLFKLDAGEMSCIRERFKNLMGEEIGIALPKEYFYFDSLSNIEGYVCLNTTNVVRNVVVVEEGKKVVKECLEESGNGNVNLRAERFFDFVGWHTPPETHGWKDWVMLGGLFGVIAPASGIALQHLYQKWLNGPKGPPPPTGPGGSGRSLISPPQYCGPRDVVKFPDAEEFSVPENGFSDMYNPIPVFAPPPQSFVPDSELSPLFNPWPQSALPGVSPAPATSPAISSSPAINLRPPTERQAQAMALIAEGAAILLAIGTFLRNPASKLAISGPKCLVGSHDGGGYLESRSSDGPL
jgi:hypothetical protein